jgi:hypothetical protein
MFKQAGILISIIFALALINVPVNAIGWPGTDIIIVEQTTFNATSTPASISARTKNGYIALCSTSNFYLNAARVSNNYLQAYAGITDLEAYYKSADPIWVKTDSATVLLNVIVYRYRLLGE